MSNRVPGTEPRLYAGDLTTVLAGDYRLDYRKWWSAGGGNTPKPSNNAGAQGTVLAN